MSSPSCEFSTGTQHACIEITAKHTLLTGMATIVPTRPAMVDMAGIVPTRHALLGQAELR